MPTTYFYYDAGKKLVHLANEEVSDAGDYIGELAELMDARAPSTRFIVSSLMRNAGHNVMGITIVTYVPLPPLENQNP